MDPNKSWQDYLNVSGEISNLSNTFTSGLDTAKKKVRDEMGYDELMKSIQPIRQSIADTEDTLTNLGSNLKTRTAGKLMTNAQLSRLKSAESDPIIEQLSSLNRGLGVKQQGVSDIDRAVDSAGTDFLTGYRNNMDTLYNKQSGAWNKYTQDWQGQQNDFNRRIQEMQINSQNAAAQRQRELQQMMIDWEREKINNQYKREDDQAAKIAGANSKPISIETETSPYLVDKVFNTPTGQTTKDISDFFGINLQKGQMSGGEYLLQSIFNPNYVKEFYSPKRNSSGGW
ncbi:MAG: hypothetical protein ACP5NS_05025 [Candidatus Pacearchaeota archaeon]